MTSETQVTDTTTKPYNPEDDRLFFIKRVNLMTCEYASIDETVIVDFLCYATAKKFDLGYIIGRSIFHFGCEFRSFNPGDSYETFEGTEVDLKAEMSALTCGMTHFHAVRAKKAKRAMRAFFKSEPGTSVWMHGGPEADVYDVLSCVLHFFVDQGKSPAEILCKAIEIFVFEVARFGEAKQPRNDEAFEKLRAAIHAYVDDAMSIVAE